MPMPFIRRFLVAVALPLLLGCNLLVAGPALALAPGTLPPAVTAALARANLLPEALSVVVAGVDAREPPRLSWRADAAVNPASVMKLVTTYAALELLGPGFTWRTSVYALGAVRQGTLAGNLHIVGGGDPKLVAERLWLLLRRVQGLGIRHIAGDIVLDASAFEMAPVDPAAFDNEPLRPYNAAPDALLVNFKSVQLDFVPDAAAGVARIHAEPPLAGVELPQTVPLSGGDCRDWRAGLQADFSDPARLRLNGRYAASCGSKSWSIAPPDPAAFAGRAMAGMWQAIGGTLAGSVRSGGAPAGLAPTIELESPSLAEVIRDVNKYSNNVMAQQLFLTLSSQSGGLGTLAGSRNALERWWRQRLPAMALPLVDNGSGLSRDARIRADALARLLQTAFVAPLMPEFIASLPIQGVDGTLRRSRAPTAGTAHLKTGSLRDVMAIAGYVDAVSGRRYVLVAVVNDPNANAARGVLDALVQWVRDDAPAAR